MYNFLIIIAPKIINNKSLDGFESLLESTPKAVGKELKCQVVAVIIWLLQFIENLYNSRN